MNPLRLIGIVGQTGSGKTSLSYQIADHIIKQGLKPVIILADSRTLFKELDIASAKPSKSQLSTYKHQMVDILNPGQKYTVYQYQQAVKTIFGNLADNEIPILVGGSGLYFDATIYDYQFPQDKSDRDRNTTKYQTKIFGFHYPRQELRARLAERLDLMIEEGLIKEVEEIMVAYGSNCIALRSTTANRARDYLLGLETMEETRRLIVRDNLSLAKRQFTWFKRNREISWNLPLAQILGEVDSLVQ
ncbi:hypothetical protein H6792_01080 [Candidatus Nomurabacteria bacterium]|nr:hypothetical protein [Candidatus Nomurabacteria bacterium]